MHCCVTFHQALSSRVKELERLKSEWSTHSAAIRNECTAQVTAEKEKALQVVALIIACCTVHFLKACMYTMCVCVLQENSTHCVCSTTCKCV